MHSSLQRRGEQSHNPDRNRVRTWLCMLCGPGAGAIDCMMDDSAARVVVVVVAKENSSRLVEDRFGGPGLAQLEVPEAEGAPASTTDLTFTFDNYHKRLVNSSGGTTLYNGEMQDYEIMYHSQPLTNRNVQWAFNRLGSDYPRST